MTKVVRPNVRQWQVAQTSKFLENWPTAGRPPDVDIRYGLQTIRARARLEAQNNDHVRGFLRLVEANVVGRDGVVFQSRAKMLGGKPDKKLQRIIEDAFAEFSKRGNFDVTGRYNRAMMERSAIRTVARDGEALFRIVQGFPNKFGFAVQEIDTECLDIQYNRNRDKGQNEIRMGVELDEWRRPVAYHITAEPGINSGSYRSGAAERMPIPADEIIHLYLPEWVHQTRGVPWTASGLARLHMLSAYEDAEVAASAASARKIGFYKKSLDAVDLPDSEKTQDLDLAEFEVLPAGYDIAPFDPQHPTSAFGDFCKSILRSVTAGWGVNYNTAANDLEGVNYSSLRHGHLNDTDQWMTLQDWFVDSFNQVIFDRWLSYQMDVMPTFYGLSTARLAEAKRCSWQPRRWPWVDPLKDQNANTEALKTISKTFSSIIREQGMDPQDVWEEYANDLKAMGEAGLPVDLILQNLFSVNRNAAPASDPNADPTAN